MAVSALLLVLSETLQAVSNTKTPADLNGLWIKPELRNTSQFSLTRHSVD